MSYQSAQPHPRERERLEALYRYAILDTEAEKGFDDLTRLASLICGTSISLISLVDHDRQWFKSKIGLDSSSSDRSVSFCAHAIHGSEIFEIPDAKADERFQQNPLVIGPPHVEFYAGAPLITPEGLPIGTLCVLDHKPRKLSDFQKEALQTLARQAISLLELKVKVRELNDEMQQHERAEQLLREHTSLAYPGEAKTDGSPQRIQKATAPLLASAMKDPRWFLPTLLLMLVLFIATLLITARSRALVDRENEQLWERQRDGITAAIKDRLAAYAELLRAGEALFAASADVTPSDWRTYVRHVATADRYPGVNAVGYVRRVKESELPEFVARARERVDENFNVRPAGDRPEYYPVLYMEPPTASAALGFDVRSEAVRRESAERSRDLGQTVISRRTTLVQDVERRAGFVMFHPIYAGSEVPMTTEERLARHVGWVYAGFRTDQLLKAIFKDRYPHLLVDIYDGNQANKSSALYLDPKGRQRILRSETMPLRVYGRDWIVVISTTERSISSEPLLVFIFGCLITLLAGATALTLSSTRRRAMVLAEAMSNAYQASERRTRAIVDNVADAIVTFDAAGSISSTNRAAEQLFAARPSELLTMNLADIFDDHQRLLHEVRDFETSARDSAGRELEIAASVTKVVDSEPPAMIAVVRDIADRKRTVREAALLQNLTVSVAEAEDLNSALVVTLQQVCDVTDWPYGEAWLPRRDGLLHRGPAWHTNDEKLKAFDAVSRRRTFQPGEGFPGRVFSEGVTARSYDLASDSTFLRLGEANQAGLNAAVGFPVIANEEVIAIILFYARSLSERDQRFVDLISWMATQLGTVISRKRAEDALKESEARTRSILKNMLGGLITMHRNGEIESVNPAAEQIFGYRESELIGKSIANLLSGASHDPDTFMRTAYERAIGKVTEWQGARFTGNTFPFELSLFEFSTTEGTRIAANVRDVSERNEVDRLKKDFVSTVSHELRTPLTSIRGSLGLLTGGVAGELPPAVTKLISIAERNSVRLIALINDILDFERLESGHMEFDLKSHDGFLIIERSLESVRSVAEQEHIELVTELSVGAVYADADRIVQVLVNFISNAIKFSSAGGKVVVRTIPHDDFLRFEVEDFGRGIPTHSLQKLFKRFQQVDASDSRRQGGTGLGLAISKAIIEQHGGVIGVESAEGEGSTFWFQIPRGETLTSEQILPVLIAAKNSEEFSELRKLVPPDRLAFECTDPKEIWEKLRTCATSLAIIQSSYLQADDFALRNKLAAEYDCARHPVIIFGESIALPPELIAKQIAIVVNPTSEADLLHSIRVAMTATKQGADVLLIEDDRELLAVMAAQLSSEGISTRTATTASEAIDMISRKVPELIVLDVGLPDHDGFEVVHALQSSEETRRIALLVHTGRDLTEEQRGRLTLGPTRFLMKSRSDEEGFRRLVADLLNAGAMQPSDRGGERN